MRNITFRYLFIVCFYLIHNNCNAQLLIQLNSIIETQAKVSDCFGAILNNQTGKVQNLYFIGTIANKSNQHIIARGVTEAGEYGVGITKLDASLLSPTYTIESPVDQSNLLLPYGTYELCLRAYVINTKELIGEGCSDIEVTPLSPPRLLYPDDNGSLDVSVPNLLWLPPMPLKFQEVIYSLKLSEVYENQTPYDAIQKNYPLLDIQGVKSTSLIYPATANQLQRGKKYAWRVSAKTEQGVELGVSESWCFSISQIDTESIFEGVITDSYVIPESQANLSIIHIRDILKVMLPDKPPIETVKFKIVTFNNKRVDTDQLKISNTGEGKFELKLTSLQLSEKESYKLLVQYGSYPEKCILFKIHKK